MSNAALDGRPILVVSVNLMADLSYSFLETRVAYE
jgi:hypothetical protein